MSRAVRTFLSASLAVLLSGGPALASENAAAALAPEVAAPYVRAQTLVDIGRRKLNLYCVGNGPTTVLFDAGGSDWSVIWALIQPEIAKRARACTYDRAGLGYSDPDEGPRTPFAIAEDMHALIGAAALKRPLILVGHSLGGFNTKLYTALYPNDVSGLILMDPSEERDADRSRAFITRGWGADVATKNELLGQRFILTLMGRWAHCAEVAEKAPLDPDSLLYKRCTDPVRPKLGPLIAQERAVIQRKAVYQQAQASELQNSVYGDHAADSAYANLFRRGMLGPKPLYVMTALGEPSGDKIDLADTAATDRLHDESAMLSTVGCRIVVANTGHNIQIDRPDAVIRAILQMVDNVEHKSAASPLRRAGDTTGGAVPRCTGWGKNG